jgi:hypothetical protein
VRNTLHAFEADGLACLKQQSSRPKTIHAEFDQPKCEALRAMLHQSPRTYGKKTSVWTLALAAEVCQEKKRRDALIALARRCGWVVGYADEVWWSRVAQPRMHSWSEAGQPLRLLERQVRKEDPDPKALSC